MANSKIKSASKAQLALEHEDAWQRIRGLNLNGTERTEIEAIFRDVVNKYHDLIEYAPVGIFKSTPAGRYLMANGRLAEMYGYDSAQDLIEGIRDIGSQAYASKKERKKILAAAERGEVERIELQRRRKDGSIIWVSLSMRAVRDENGKVIHYEGFSRDITERKLIERAMVENEERFRLAMEASRDGLWDWNVSTGEVYYSPGYASMLGYTAQEVFPNEGFWSDHIHPDDKEMALKANMDCIENYRNDFEIEFRMLAKNGDWRWILGRGKAVARNSNKRALRMVGTHTDITERKRIEHELKMLVTTDPLTGAKNRRYFYEQFEKEFNRSKRHGDKLVFMMIDVDHFKSINDKFGHDGGDIALKKIVSCCQNTLRSYDLFCRIGGDEFGALLVSVDREDGLRIAERLRHNMKNYKIDFNDDVIEVSVSIGLVQVLENEASVDSLIKKADIALYKSKATGRDKVCIFDME